MSKESFASMPAGHKSSFYIINEKDIVILCPLSFSVYFKGLLNGHLGSPQSKFQISNYHLPYRKLVFSSINTYICALNQGAHTSFTKMIFWKQIRMSLVIEYNWHETAVFTKYKHIILTWINSLKYSAWQ
jgi:hypothetical protein